MSSKKILFPLFILLALIQLYFPGRMVWDMEDVLISGTEYKFRTAPVDPYDPFRGKYITLDYQDTEFEVDDPEDWDVEELVFVTIQEDKEGFAIIKDITREEPEGELDYIKCNVRRIYFSDGDRLEVEYPFDRFYMEESKAGPAETAYNESNRDSLSTTYALVNVKKGNAVLKDVIIDGQSATEIDPTEPNP